MIVLDVSLDTAYSWLNQYEESKLCDCTRGLVVQMRKERTKNNSTISWNILEQIQNVCTQSSSDAEIAEVTSGDATQDLASGSLPSVSVGNFDQLAAQVIEKCCKALMDAEPELTKFDTIVGDGDCGITMARGAKEISQ